VVEDDALGSLKGDPAPVLQAGIAALERLDDWSTAAIEQSLRTALIDGLELKPRVAFGPLRVAVSGRRISPPLFESMEILGKQSTLTRLRSLAAR
jgi:glutamyl-tRNA synthetase